MSASLPSQNRPALAEASDDQGPAGGKDTPATSAAGTTAPAGPGFTWLEVGIIAGIWGLLTAVSIVRMLTSSCCAPSGYSETMVRVTSTLSYTTAWLLFAVPVFWACRHLQPRRVGWGATLAGHFALAFGIMVVVELGFGYYIRYALATIWRNPDPIRSLPTMTARMFSNLSFLGELPPYLLLLFFGVGRDAYQRYLERRMQAERLQRESDRLRAQLTSARLEALRMQINPHFLYNTLHTISTMAGHNPEGIRNATARLSEMMRYALSTSDQQETPLKKEVEVLRSYLEIQKLRLEERLEVTIDVGPEAQNALVPTLLLQPLAENAVKHGFEGSEGTGRLYIRAARVNTHLIVQVADDGKGVGEEVTLPEASQRPDATNGTNDSGEGIGLDNLAQRLDGLYGEAASLTFQASDGGGLQVTIRLPFYTRERDRSLRASGLEPE